MFITESARQIPVVHEVDICVLGGSCTGVFAAVRAARLGKKVLLVEKTNAFGGVATNGLVNVWHSELDAAHERQIIGGLTMEVVERLRRRGQSINHLQSNDVAHILNTEELKIELDELVLEHNIIPMLHTVFCVPVVDSGTIQAVIVENKDGRQAICAKVFVDATGDGDLAARCELPYTVSPHLQPPTTCAKIRNFMPSGFNYREMYVAHHEEFGLEMDSGWHIGVPGMEGFQMFAQTHVFGANCSDATQLTQAEMTGRRQVRAIMDMIRKYGPQGNDMALAELASQIGIRETRRFEGVYRLTEEDVLHGKRFPDAIANGSYRVDVHYPEEGGYIFKYLDGTTQDYRGGQMTAGRWREEQDVNPTFYQIPYRSMVHAAVRNLILAGRMISTDTGAFGAVRVMVNLNQTGEAAGTAAVLALNAGSHVMEVRAEALRQCLAEGGSIII
ncbi:MAG: FAD-dependent oxidoreductase [Planctomycetes bacterium]|nr:FAD-dependent oxidoreductase [Planctomycetota bacterium]